MTLKNTWAHLSLCSSVIRTLCCSLAHSCPRSAPALPSLSHSRRRHLQPRRHPQRSQGRATPPPHLQPRRSRPRSAPLSRPCSATLGPPNTYICCQQARAVVLTRLCLTHLIRLLINEWMLDGHLRWRLGTPSLGGFAGGRSVSLRRRCQPSLELEMEAVICDG